MATTLKFETLGTRVVSEEVKTTLIAKFLKLTNDPYCTRLSATPFDPGAKVKSLISPWFRDKLLAPWIIVIN